MHRAQRLYFLKSTPSVYQALLFILLEICGRNWQRRRDIGNLRMLVVTKRQKIWRKIYLNPYWCGFFVIEGQEIWRKITPNPYLSLNPYRSRLLSLRSRKSEDKYPLTITGAGWLSLRGRKSEEKYLLTIIMEGFCHWEAGNLTKISLNPKGAGFCNWEAGNLTKMALNP